MSFLVYFGYKPQLYAVGDFDLQALNEAKYSEDAVGFSGIYLNRNVFSFVLIISALTTYATILETQSKRIKKILFTILSLTLVLVVLSISRGAIATLFLILLLYMTRNYKNKSNLYILLTLTAFIAIINIYFYETIKVLGDRFANDGSSSRDVIWADAIQTFMRNPLGVGNYTYVLPNGGTFHAHNVYLDSLASVGIISSFFWFLWLLTGIKHSVRNFKNRGSKINKKSTVFIACILIGILLHQIIESTLLDIYTVYTYFFIVVLAQNINSKINSSFKY